MCFFLKTHFDGGRFDAEWIGSWAHLMENEMSEQKKATRGVIKRETEETRKRRRARAISEEC